MYDFDFTWTAEVRPFTKVNYFFPTWISNYIQYKVWNEINYPFPIFNGLILIIISNFITQSTEYGITRPCWDLS